MGVKELSDGHNIIENSDHINKKNNFGFLHFVTARPIEAELLPKPMQPKVVPQQMSQLATKKKRARHAVRPGYARQPDSKG